MRRLHYLVTWMFQPLHLFMIALAIIPFVHVVGFCVRHGTAFPYGDDWTFNADMAIRAYDGTLRPGDFFQVSKGHRIVFTRAMAALFTPLNGWSSPVEVGVNVLFGVLNFGLIAALIAKQHLRLLPWMLPILSIAIFSTYQTENWLVGVHSHWHFATFFVLVALVSLHFLPQGWPAIVVAAIASVCATFSFSSGLISWPVVIVTMWLLGYRRIRDYLLYVLVGIVAIWLYTPPSSATTFDAHIGQMLVFLMTYLGSPLSANVRLVGTLLGGLVLVVFAANLVNRKIGLQVWLPLALYALGNGALLALARFDGDLLYIAILKQYVHVSSLFWVATLGLVLGNLFAFLNDRHGVDWYRHLLVRGNVLFVAAFLGAALVSSVNGSRWMNFQAPVETMKISAQCALDYPLTRDESCLLNADARLSDHLAARRLSGYHQQQAQFVLPETYHPADTVIIHTDSLWLNLHIRDWLLDGIAGTRHLVPPDQISVLESEIQHTPNPPSRLYVDVTDIAPDSNGLWLIQNHAAATEQRFALNRLLIDRYVLLSALELPAQLKAYRYVRPPDFLETSIHFGPSLRLDGWRVSDFSVTACAAVSLVSAWHTEVKLTSDVRMTFVLADRNGIGAARQDGPIAPFLEGREQYDERSLTVPCEIAPGDYDVLLGVYQADSLEPLPASFPDGTPLGDLFYLTTLTVD